MKTLLWIMISVCLVITTTCITEEHQKLKNRRKQAIEECREENPEVSDEDFAAVRTKKSPKNEIQFCALECVYEKMGIVKDDKLVYEEITKAFRIMFEHDQTLLRDVLKVSDLCKKEVERDYGSIKECGVPDAFHQCVMSKWSVQSTMELNM